MEKLRASVLSVHYPGAVGSLYTMAVTLRVNDRPALRRDNRDARKQRCPLWGDAAQKLKNGLLRTPRHERWGEEKSRPMQDRRNTCGT